VCCTTSLKYSPPPVYSNESPSKKARLSIFVSPRSIVKSESVTNKDDCIVLELHLVRTDPFDLGIGTHFRGVVPDVKPLVSFY
jgi:hypothetical protein